MLPISRHSGFVGDNVTGRKRRMPRESKDMSSTWIILVEEISESLYPFEDHNFMAIHQVPTRSISLKTELSRVSISTPITVTGFAGNSRKYDGCATVAVSCCSLAE